MISRMLVSIIIFVLALLIVAGSCTTGKKIISVNNAIKDFEGIFVNTEYPGSLRYPQKIVITSDGRVGTWFQSYPKNFSDSAEYKIVESWRDSKGNIYCKVDAIWGGGLGTNELWRLDKARITFERNYIYAVHEEYPTEINPNPEASIAVYYMIYYRQ